MKKFLTILALLVFPAAAFAYTSHQGTDPRLGNFEYEVKTAQKSSTADYNAALAKGSALFYSTATGELAGLYKVSAHTASGATTATALPYQACIATRAVATADTSLFPCVTRGYVDYALYSAAVDAIVAGDYLCPNGSGVLVKCTAGVVSRFIALEAKSSGTGSNLKVRVRSE
jgi:hypothetical protein